jgi:hypothetical protein
MNGARAGPTGDLVTSGASNGDETIYRHTGNPGMPHSMVESESDREIVRRAQASFVPIVTRSRESLVQTQREAEVLNHIV